MFGAGIVLNIGLIYRRGAMGTATTPATTPAQKIRIYRYIKIDRGDVFSTAKTSDLPSCKTLVNSSFEKEKSSAKKKNENAANFRISAVGPIDWSILARKRGRTPEKR